MARNEIDRLKTLSHPRIIDYYGYKEVDGRSIYIFMEYMAAGSLLKIIKECGLINESASIKYIDQILDGLSYIHGIGIVHSDLKCLLTD
jgi:serine/threonine protein kinase